MLFGRKFLPSFFRKIVSRRAFGSALKKCQFTRAGWALSWKI
jgi:hypothetical protein